MGFPSGPTRVLITLALLSNAFLLDFFSLSRGYGLALGFTVLALSFLLQASLEKSLGDQTARRWVTVSLWLAFGAALSNMAFVYFYAPVLAVTVWLSWRNRLKVCWWINALVLGVFYLPRMLVARRQDALYFGGDVGFVRNTVGSLVRCCYYDCRVSAGLVELVSVLLVLLVGFLAYWTYRERISSGFILSMLSILAAILCIAAHALLHVKFLEERAALFFVPVAMLNIGVVAARSPLRLLRLFLWGVLLTLAWIGLQGGNLSHTLSWRENADIPSALLALQGVHQRTGEHVMVAHSSSKWTIWYYAEHLLRLHRKSSGADQPYQRTYDWFTVYEWKACQPYYGFPADHPFIPGTTHLLLDRADTHLLAAQLAAGHMQLNSYPDSEMTLYTVTAPEHEGTMTFPSGEKYVGQLEDGQPNGFGTATFPDGRKYVGRFRDGEPNGHGTVTVPDERKYVGEFKDGVPNGRGTATLPNGQVYVGQFQSGMMEGVGKMTLPDGTVQDGLWKQNQFVGPVQ